MLIGFDSPLRRLPMALESKQALFLEGIRICLEMIDLAHFRLQTTLQEVAEFAETIFPNSQLALTAALIDAWSIIDSIHRLRGLIQHLPNFRHRNQNPAIHNFMKDSEVVVGFRNTVQHLDATIRKSDFGPDWSVWGSLAWCVPSSTTDEVRSCMYASGRMKPGSRQLINPAGKTILLPVGVITLSQDTASICVSDLVVSVQKLAGEIQEICAVSFGSDPRLKETYGSDCVVRLDMAPAKSGETHAE